MSRLLTLLVVLFAGAAGLALAALSARNRLAVGALAGLVLATQAPAAWAAFFNAVNGRWHAYDQTALHGELDRLAPGAPIVWLDTDLAMPPAFIEGAYKRPALPEKAIGDPAEIADLARGERVLIAGTPPQRLNSLSVLLSRSLAPRFFGWTFMQVSRVDLLARKAPFRQAHVRLSGDPRDLRLEAYQDDQPCDAAFGARRPDGWIAIEIKGCAAPDQIRLVSSCERRCPDLRLTGFQFGAPSPGRLWPWGIDGAFAAAYPRANESDLQSIDFSLNGFLHANASDSLAPYLTDPVFEADESGIVWFSARLSPSAQAP